MLAVYRACRSESANVRHLFRGLTVSFSAAAFTIAFMAIHLGGVAAPTCMESPWWRWCGLH